jgi:hypothetical protein
MMPKGYRKARRKAKGEVFEALGDSAAGFFTTPNETPHNTLDFSSKTEFYS